MQKTLLLGASHAREKQISRSEDNGQWIGELVTLDMNPDCGASVVWDLENRPLPFADETFTEIHAYDVLEHVGRQGDWRDFFDQFAEYWRLLVPGGVMGIIVPIGDDYFTDPGHSRFYDAKHFYMLSQSFYEGIGPGVKGGDYRWYWKRNFEVVHIEKHTGPAPIGDHHLCVMLQKA